MTMRQEKDSLGAMDVPESALYGAQTRRAELNFPISGYRMPRRFLEALGRIKRSAARVNAGLERLDEERAGWIETAAAEVVNGVHDDQFVVDVFQTGSGTSTNMNVNEVVANRAIRLAGGVVGSKEPVHPNDHVNMGQSSNDVIPTALHVAAAVSLQEELFPALSMLEECLLRKATAFDAIVKIGRTHLQDATPIRLGQVFSGYAAQVASGRRRLEQAMDSLLELPIGGTAVGTGINTHPEFGARVASELSQETGLSFREAANHFEAQAVRDGAVETMAILKTVALSVSKIANDIRFLASGPRCGIGELQLPSIQPGSSIMPGKVNPVICEAVMQTAAHIVGADAAVSHGAAILSNYELSVAMPLMAYHLLESIRIFANASRTFVVQCLEELEANEERCSALVEDSLAMCTSLAPLIGYDAAAAIAKEAYASGRTVRDVASEVSGLDAQALQAALDPSSMTRPQ